MLREYAGVPEPALRRHPALRDRRRPDPAQARGPQPHRRAQDPQRARPGAAHPADGQDPDDRRDRRRPARRRDRHRGGVPRPGVRRLHGRGRHPAPGAQRRPDAAARRRGPVGHHRAAARSRTRSTRRSATGSPASTTRRTASARPPARTRSRRWCATSAAGIGDEARAQCLELTGALPDVVTACVGGGSNAIGLFTAFLDDADVRLVGFEAGRRGRGDPAARRDDHAPATSGCCTARAPSCCRTRTARRSSRTRSRPGWTTRAWARARPPRETGRADYRSVTDAEAMDALALLARTEGIICAIESAHAVAGALQLAEESPGQHDPGEPLRPRRQGHGHDRGVVRPGRPGRDGVTDEARPGARPRRRPRHSP